MPAREPSITITVGNKVIYHGLIKDNMYICRTCSKTHTTPNWHGDSCFVLNVTCPICQQVTECHHIAPIYIKTKE